MIRKRGSKFVLFDKTGKKKLGTFKTWAAAENQYDRLRPTGPGWADPTRLRYLEDREQEERPALQDQEEGSAEVDE